MNGGTHAPRKGLHTQLGHRRRHSSSSSPPTSSSQKEKTVEFEFDLHRIFFGSVPAKSKIQERPLFLSRRLGTQTVCVCPCGVSCPRFVRARSCVVDVNDPSNLVLFFCLSPCVYQSVSLSFKVSVDHTVCLFLSGWHETKKLSVLPPPLVGDDGVLGLVFWWTLGG